MKETERRRKLGNEVRQTLRIPGKSKEKNKIKSREEGKREENKEKDTLRNWNISDGVDGFKEAWKGDKNGMEWNGRNTLPDITFVSRFLVIL